MPPSRRLSGHAHIGAVAIATAFTGVLLMGTLWKLTAARLAVSGSPTKQAIAGAMIAQYG